MWYYLNVQFQGPSAETCSSLILAIDCILFSAFIDCCINCTNKHGLININIFTKAQCTITKPDTLLGFVSFILISAMFFDLVPRSFETLMMRTDW